ncbi:MAG: GntR family transcriptional regulator [Fastidiosipilaceae bacterium]|jgi:GntR family transcriptional regulator|nr:GntR family transcriptional regulator [Clostridiaceae bacterium]
MKVDRNSNVPLYVQVKDAIMDVIKDGTYKSGTRIPSESELGEIFDVSRPTIRQAVSELIAEGVLVIKKGRGTYVVYQDQLCTIDPFKPSSFSFLASTSIADYHFIKVDPASYLPDYLLEAYRIDPANDEAQSFAANFWEIIWLESQERVPYVLCKSYIPVAMFPKLKEQIENKKNMLIITANKYPLLPNRCRAEVSIKFVNSAVNMHLNCAIGTPMLVKRVIMKARTGDICEVSEAIIRSDIVSLRMYEDSI